MKKILFSLIVALSLIAARGAEASMDSGLFLFTDGEATIMVATSIWADDLTDSAAVSARLRYPLIVAVKNKLNEGELTASAHSTMAFMYRVKRSATISFFKSASMNRDEALIELSRHSGTGSVPFDKFSAKVSDLLKMSDLELKKWIDETASRIVSGWRSEK